LIFLKGWCGCRDLNPGRQRGRAGMGVNLLGFNTAASNIMIDKDWADYRKFLEGKYSTKQGISLIYSYTLKYHQLLQDPARINEVPLSIRNNVLKGLMAYSKFLGCHEEFTKRIKNHGIKWSQGDSLNAFNRIFNSNGHSELGKWYNEASQFLTKDERLYLRYMVLSGIRKEEGINSFNLLVSLNTNYSEYYNEATGFLEHFKYPKLFIRNSKNLYVSAVPKELIEQIVQSNEVSYEAIRKKLLKQKIKMRIKELRSFYATNMRQLGLLSEQIDLVQGRIGKGIFMQHYFKQNPKPLNRKIIRLLPKLEMLLQKS